MSYKDVVARLKQVNEQQTCVQTIDKSLLDQVAGGATSVSPVWIKAEFLVKAVINF